MMTDKQQQEEELLILKSILGDIITDLSNNNDQFEVNVEFQLPTPFYLHLIDSSNHLSTLIQHLPPLILTVHFHEHYPSSRYSPTFVLSSCYLSHEYLKNICQTLDKIWEQNISQPIVYQWIECLKEQFLTKSALCLSTKDVDDDTDGDPRAMSRYDPSRAAHIYEHLIEYNQIKENENFLREYHECPICMTNSIAGWDMLRLYKCHHAFCRLCLHDYARMRINTGSVQWLLCPDLRCKLALLPSEIKIVVNDDQLYDKYERLLLQKTLEQMDDIVWCPRCQQAVLTGNEKDNLALCDQCRFAFCKKCKNTYHSQTLCGYELELAELSKTRRKLRREMQEAFNFILDDEEKLLKEFLAVARVETSTRLCPNPHCQVPIEKNMGCDHMFCIRCQRSFNWSDAKEQTTEMRILLEKYESDLGKVQEALENERSDENPDESNSLKIPIISQLILKRTKKCPNIMCKKLNIKSGTGNYLICQYCKRGYCFSCGNSVISPARHFGHVCKRHSII